MRLVCLFGLLLTTSASASSDDAWEEFRAEVETSCRSAAGDILETPEIVVDPFGSESYGIAVLVGVERGGDDVPRSVVCVFDKASRSAQIGTPLDLPAHETARPESGAQD